MLKITNLHACIDNKPIIKGLDLTIEPGQVHVLMGPNGAGKSTLAKILAGHPAYEVTQGSIEFLGKDLTELEPHERVHLGLFLTFQYPIEVPGVTNREFLFQSVNAQLKAAGKALYTQEAFDEVVLECLKNLQMKAEFLDRSVNEGFSGGEKKKNEILQMQLFNPLFSILDETDSGLDIDSMKVVAEGINAYQAPEKGILLITHYQRLLDYIKPDYIHVIIDGQIVHTGDASFALELEKEGYDRFLSGGLK